MLILMQEAFNGNGSSSHYGTESQGEAMDGKLDVGAQQCVWTLRSRMREWLL